MIKIYIPKELVEVEREQKSIFKVLQRDPSKFNCSFVEHCEDANFAILPVNWSDYYLTGRKKLIRKFYDTCREKGIAVLSYNPGDHGVKIPSFANHKRSFVLRQSGLRSKLPQNHYGCPVFWFDPLPFMGLKDTIIREKSLEPIVGFCGQAIDSTLRKIAKPFFLFSHNVRSIVGLIPEDKEDWFIPPTKLRRKALRILNSQQHIRTNFILREKYKAGVRVKGTEEERKVRIEFYQNMLDSDYVLCVRGSGNFSARFYETLAMGRIPLVVETDQLWPLEDIIKWNEYGLFVPFRELHNLPEQLLAFHDSLTNEDFKSLQMRCRKLWEEKLTLENFIEIFLKKMMKESQ